MSRRIPKLPAHETNLATTTSTPDCQSCAAQKALEGALNELSQLEEAALKAIEWLPYDVKPQAADIATPAYKRAIAVIGPLAAGAYA